MQKSVQKRKKSDVSSKKRKSSWRNGDVRSTFGQKRPCGVPRKQRMLSKQKLSWKGKCGRRSEQEADSISIN